MAYQEIVSTGSIYKGRTSMWLYLFHRVTGVALLVIYSYTLFLPH